MEPPNEPKYPTMDNVQARLETFSKWPLTDPAPKEMVACGFFCNNDDDVTCFFCGIKYGGWVRGDNPWLHHYSASNGSCQFIHENPMYPDMKSFEARFETFKDWPELDKDLPTTEQLAARGFFYSSTWKVTCYFCGASIEKPWEDQRYYYCPLKKWPEKTPKSHLPKYPAMSDEGDREKTLSAAYIWLPEAFAKCGFFFSDKRLVCFWCGCSLQDNRHLDDVCIEHVRASERQCPFALQNERSPEYFRVPKHPIYSRFEARLNSFEAWDNDHQSHPPILNLAQCGFFSWDFEFFWVICFHCGRFFGPDDFRHDADPWEVHVKGAKGLCPFVLENRKPWKTWPPEKRQRPFHI